MATNFGSIGNVWVEVGAELARLRADLNAAIAEGRIAGEKLGQGFTQGTESSMRGFGAVVNEALGSFSGAALAAGAALSAGVTVPLVKLATESLSLSANLETASAAFTHMLGSAEAAGAFMRELKQFALDTPFDFPELVPLAQRLKAFGFEAKEIIPTLRILGDTMGLLGGGTEGMNRVATAIAQISNSARLSAADMKQLTEAGVAAWKILADASGKTVAEIRKLSEDGAISGAAAARMILAGMEKEFGGGMAKLADTLAGQWTKVREQISFALGDIGDALRPFAQIAIDVLAKQVLPAIREITEAFRGLPREMQAGVVAIAAIAAAAGPALLALGGISATIAAIGAAAPVLAPIAGIVAGIGLAIAGLNIAGVGEHFKEFFRTLSVGWPEIKRQVTEVGEAIRSLIPGWISATAEWGASVIKAATGMEALKAAFVSMIPGVKEWLLLLTTGRTIIEQLTGRSGQRDDSMFAGVAKAAKSTADAMRSVADEHIKMFGGEAGLAQRKFQRELEKSESLLKQLFTTAKEKGKELKDTFVSLDEAFQFLGKFDTKGNIFDFFLKGLEETNKATAETIKLQREMEASTEGLMANLAASSLEWIKANNLVLPSIGSITDALKAARDPVYLLDEAFKKFGITSIDSLMKQAEGLREAERLAVALHRPLFEILQTQQKRLETELAIATAQGAEPQRLAAISSQLQAVNGQLDGMTGKQRQVIDLGAEMGKQFTLTFDRLGQDVAKSITGAASLGEAFTNAWRAIRDGLLELVVKALMLDLKNALLGVHGQVSELSKAFMGLGKSILSIFGVSTQAASGTAAGAAASGAQNVGGSLLSTTGIISSLVNAVTGVLSLFQGRRMEQDIGRIEVSARGILAEHLNLRTDLWKQHYELMSKMDQGWEILRAMAAGAVVAGGLAGSAGGHLRIGENTIPVSLEKLADEAAEAINVVTVSMDGLGKEMGSTGVTAEAFRTEINRMNEAYGDAVAGTAALGGELQNLAEDAVAAAEYADLKKLYVQMKKEGKENTEEFAEVVRKLGIETGTASRATKDASSAMGQTAVASSRFGDSVRGIGGTLQAMAAQTVQASQVMQESFQAMGTTAKEVSRAMQLSLPPIDLETAINPLPSGSRTLSRASHGGSNFQYAGGNLTVQLNIDGDRVAETVIEAIRRKTGIA